MISFRDVSKEYDGHLVVDHVHLDFKEGEKHVLIGTSGSGKTTLLKMINKIIPKSGGQILVEGKNTEDWNEVALRRQLGYVIQEVGLFPHYSVAENIAIVPTILRWSREKIKARTNEVMEMVGLDERYLPLLPDALSGGQQQRVGIARALAANPSTLLMDEPFGALDPITRNALQQEFIKMPGISDKTVILVTHDMMEAALLGEIITVLDHGRIQQTGRLEELLFKPANAFVENFLRHQRDQLELRAVKVRTILPWLSVTDGMDQRQRLPMTTTLHDLPDGTLIFGEGENTFSASRQECYSLYYRHRDEIIEKLHRHG